jgi:hypothetical protein
MQEWFATHYEVLKDFSAPALTIIGFIIALSIAVAAFQSLKKWRGQQIEERRIETALDALAVTYESKYVFDNIRSPMVFEYEWNNMQRRPGEPDEIWQQRAAFFAVKQRILNHRDYFERVYKLQPRVMALLGQKAEQVFMLMHKARREIEVAADMLAWRVQNPIGPEPNHDEEFWRQCKRDIYDYGDFEPNQDKVGKKLVEFREKMEALCRPVIDKGI